MIYTLDMVMKYLWLVLVAVIVVVVAIVIVLPNTGVRSVCTGFQYFVFLDQKATQDSYSIELLDGIRDITVKDFSVNEMAAGQTASVKSGDSFLLTAPTSGKSGDVFSYRISVSYDIINGIQDNRDTAVCTGRVQ